MLQSTRVRSLVLYVHNGSDNADLPVINYHDTLEDRRVVSQVEPGYLAKLIPDHAPQDGENWEDIQKDIEDKIVPGLTHWQHPRYMAWFPCNSTYPGILGEMFSATFNSANFNWICSPGMLYPMSLGLILKIPSRSM